MRRAFALLVAMVGLGIVAQASSAPVSSSVATTQSSGPQLAIEGGHFTLDGKPTFLMMARAFSACPTQGVIDDTARLGVFMMDHTGWICPTTQDPNQIAQKLQGVLGDKMLWLEHDTSLASAMEGMSQLVSWSGELSLEANPAAQASCNGSTTRLYNSVNEQTSFEPVIFELFLQDQLVPGRANCLTGSDVTQIAWTLATASVSGVYLILQHPWHAQDGVTLGTGVSSSAQKAFGQIKSLQAALMSPVISTLSSGAVRAKIHRYNGVRYMFAVNTSSQADKAIFRLTGATKKLTVWHEGRSLSMKLGKFSDSFEPGAHHVYVIP